MTFQQLQYLLEVYRTGSISGAAANLFVAQSNLSAAIRSAEQELGFPVFSRSVRGVEATERGLAVLSYAGKIMDSYGKMQKIGENAAVPKVRISGIQYTPVCDAYIELCKEYQDSPAVDFSYETNLTPEEALNQVYLSMKDLAVIMLHPQYVDQMGHRCNQKNLVFQKIADIPIVLRIGPKHPLYNTPEIHLPDFSGYTFVDYSNRVFADFPNINSILHIQPERIVYCSEHIMKNQLISETSMYGLGCKLTPASNQRYRFRCIPLGDLHYSLYAITQNNGVPSPVSERYVEILTKMLQIL